MTEKSWFEAVCTAIVPQYASKAEIKPLFNSVLADDPSSSRENLSRSGFDQLLRQCSATVFHTDAMRRVVGDESGAQHLLLYLLDSQGNLFPRSREFVQHRLASSAAQIPGRSRDVHKMLDEQRGGAERAASEPAASTGTRTGDRSDSTSRARSPLMAVPLSAEAKALARTPGKSRGSSRRSASAVSSVGSSPSDIGGTMGRAQGGESSLTPLSMVVSDSDGSEAGDGLSRQASRPVGSGAGGISRPAAVNPLLSPPGTWPRAEESDARPAAAQHVPPSLPILAGPPGRGEAPPTTKARGSAEAGSASPLRRRVLEERRRRAGAAQTETQQRIPAAEEARMDGSHGNAREREGSAQGRARRRPHDVAAATAALAAASRGRPARQARSVSVPRSQPSRQIISQHEVERVAGHSPSRGATESLAADRPVAGRHGRRASAYSATDRMDVLRKQGSDTHGANHPYFAQDRSPSAPPRGGAALASVGKPATEHGQPGIDCEVDRQPYPSNANAKGKSRSMGRSGGRRITGRSHSIKAQQPQTNVSGDLLANAARVRGRSIAPLLHALLATYCQRGRGRASDRSRARRAAWPSLGDRSRRSIRPTQETKDEDDDGIPLAGLSEFRRLCQDAGLVGRGGQGGGRVTTGDIDTVFRSAVAQSAGVGHLGKLRIWKKHSFAVETQGRSMLHLRLNADGFVAAAARLARRRYCAPSWLEAGASSGGEAKSDGEGSEADMSLWERAQRWRRRGQRQVHAREVTPSIAKRLAVLQHWLPLAAACGVDTAILEDIALPLYAAEGEHVILESSSSSAESDAGGSETAPHVHSAGDSAVLAARQHIERSLVGMKWKGQPLSGFEGKKTDESPDQEAFSRETEHPARLAEAQAAAAVSAARRHLGSVLGPRAREHLGLALTEGENPSDGKATEGRGVAGLPDGVEAPPALDRAPSPGSRRNKRSPHSPSPERVTEPLYATRLRRRSRGRPTRADPPQDPSPGSSKLPTESTGRQPEDQSAVTTLHVTAMPEPGTAIVYAGPARRAQQAMRKAQVTLQDRDGYQSDGAIMRLAERELGLFAARAGKHDPYKLHRSVGVYAARFAARSLRGQRLARERELQATRARTKKTRAETSKSMKTSDDADAEKPAIAGRNERASGADGDDGQWSVVSAPADEPVASMSGVRAVQAPFDDQQRPFAGWLSAEAAQKLDATRRLDLSGKVRTDRQRAAAGHLAQKLVQTPGLALEVARLDLKDSLRETSALQGFSEGKKEWRADFESDLPSGGGGLFSETLEERRRTVPVAGIGFATDQQEQLPHYARPTMCSPVPTFRRATRTFALAHNLESPGEVIARDDEKAGAVTNRRVGLKSSLRRSASAGASSRRVTVNLADLARSVGLEMHRVGGAAGSDELPGAKGDESNTLALRVQVGHTEPPTAQPRSRSVSPGRQASTSPPRNAALSEKLFPRSKRHGGFSQEGFMPRRRRMQSDVGSPEAFPGSPSRALADSPLAASIAKTRDALLSSDEEDGDESRQQQEQDEGVVAAAATAGSSLVQPPLQVPRALAMEAPVLSPAVSKASRGVRAARQRMSTQLAATLLSEQQSSSGRGAGDFALSRTHQSARSERQMSSRATAGKHETRPGWGSSGRMHDWETVGEASVAFADTLRSSQGAPEPLKDTEEMSRASPSAGSKARSISAIPSGQRPPAQVQALRQALLKGKSVLADPAAVGTYRAALANSGVAGAATPEDIVNPAAVVPRLQEAPQTTGAPAVHSMVVPQVDPAPSTTRVDWARGVERARESAADAVDRSAMSRGTEQRDHQSDTAPVDLTASPGRVPSLQQAEAPVASTSEFGSDPSHSAAAGTSATSVGVTESHQRSPTSALKPRFDQLSSQIDGVDDTGESIARGSTSRRVSGSDRHVVWASQVQVQEAIEDEGSIVDSHAASRRSVRTGTEVMRGGDFPALTATSASYAGGRISPVVASSPSRLDLSDATVAAESPVLGASTIVNSSGNADGKQVGQPPEAKTPKDRGTSKGAYTANLPTSERAQRLWQRQFLSSSPVPMQGLKTAISPREPLADHIGEKQNDCVLSQSPRSPETASSEKSCGLTPLEEESPSVVSARTPTGASPGDQAAPASPSDQDQSKEDAGALSPSSLSVPGRKRAATPDIPKEQIGDAAAAVVTPSPVPIRSMVRSGSSPSPQRTHPPPSGHSPSPAEPASCRGSSPGARRGQYRPSQGVQGSAKRSLQASYPESNAAVPVSSQTQQLGHSVPNLQVHIGPNGVTVTAGGSKSGSSRQKPSSVRHLEASTLEDRALRNSRANRGSPQRTPAEVTRQQKSGSRSQQRAVQGGKGQSWRGSAMVKVLPDGGILVETDSSGAAGGLGETMAPRSRTFSAGEPFPPYRRDGSGGQPWAQTGEPAAHERLGTQVRGRPTALSNHPLSAAPRIRGEEGHDEHPGSAHSTHQWRHEPEPARSADPKAFVSQETLQRARSRQTPAQARQRRGMQTAHRPLRAAQAGGLGQAEADLGIHGDAAGSQLGIAKQGLAAPPHRRRAVSATRAHSQRLLTARRPRGSAPGTGALNQGPSDVQRAYILHGSPKRQPKFSPRRSGAQLGTGSPTSRRRAAAVRRPRSQAPSRAAGRKKGSVSPRSRRVGEALARRDPLDARSHSESAPMPAMDQVASLLQQALSPPGMETPDEVVGVAALEAFSWQEIGPPALLDEQADAATTEGAESPELGTSDGDFTRARGAIASLTGDFTPQGGANEQENPQNCVNAAFGFVDRVEQPAYGGDSRVPGAACSSRSRPLKHRKVGSVGAAGPGAVTREIGLDGHPALASGLSDRTGSGKVETGYSSEQSADLGHAPPPPQLGAPQWGRPTRGPHMRSASVPRGTVHSSDRHMSPQRTDTSEPPSTSEPSTPERSGPGARVAGIRARPGPSLALPGTLTPLDKKPVGLRSPGATPPRRDRAVQEWAAEPSEAGAGAGITRRGLSSAAKRRRASVSRLGRSGVEGAGYGVGGGDSRGQSLGGSRRGVWMGHGPVGAGEGGSSRPSSRSSSPDSSFGDPQSGQHENMLQDSSGGVVQRPVAAVTPGGTRFHLGGAPRRRGAAAARLRMAVHVEGGPRGGTRKNFGMY